MRFFQIHRPVLQVGSVVLELFLLAHFMLYGHEVQSRTILGLVACVLMGFIWICFGWRSVLAHLSVILFCWLGQISREQPLSGLQFSKTATYRGRVVRTDFRAEGKMDLIVDLDERISPLQQELEGRIRINLAERCFIANDSIVQVTGRIYPPKSFDNIGVYNHRLNMRIRNLWGSMYLARCDDVHRHYHGGLSFLERLRRAILDELVLQSDLNPSETISRDVFAALLLGTATLDEQVLQSAQMAGISHLFAISGSHFAVMSLIVFGSVSFLMSFAPNVFLKCPRQKIAAVVTIGFVVLFLALAEYRTSIMRSGCMMLVYLMARLCHRRGFDVYIVLCSAVLLLLYNPLQIFEVSFQLTYICVLFLVLVYPTCERLVHLCLPAVVQNRILKLFIAMSLLSVTIQLFLLPYVIYRFDGISFGGFVNNLWAVPLFEFLVTPFSFVYLFVAGLSLPVEPYLLNVWDFFWLYFSGYLQNLNEAFGSNITIFSPSSEVLFVMYICVFLALYFKSRKGLILCGFVSLVLVLFTGYQHRYAYEARIIQFDVDQGDATLIQSGGETILIDTGGHAYFDIGKSVLVPALRHLWVDHIDLVVITHPDLDHFYGLTGLIGRVSIGEIWISPHVSGEKLYQELLDQIVVANIPLRTVTRGALYTLSNGSRIRILWPNADAEYGGNKNDNSIVALFESENVQLLVGGDAPKSVERQISSDIPQSTLRLLKVGHHGSSTSTDDLLLHRFYPQVALIGVGELSRFGHPNRTVLQKLDRVGARVLRTDVHGMIELRIKDDQVHVETYYP